ncbi:MAG: hypothetical protein ACHQQQ_13900 [Bacteroidota bacterium]
MNDDFVDRFSPLTSPHTSYPGHIEGVWEHLQNEYDKITKEISSNEMITVKVILFNGQEIVVNTFGYAGPNFLIVYGFLKDKEITAYIHQSSLQVLFSKISKDEKQPRRSIGFVHPKNPETQGKNENDQLE